MPDNYVFLKNINGEVIKPRTDLAALDLTEVNGIVVDDNTIGIMDGYVQSSYYMSMVEGTTAANPSSSYIEGGTMFSLIGGYTVSDEIPPAVDASPDKIPSELSVRSAIDALATVGPSITPGGGIQITTVEGSTGGILSVAGGDGISVAAANAGGVSVVAGDGITVDNTGVSVNPGDGLTLGVSGSTNEGKVITDNADVDEVLGGIDSKVLSPKSLTGALSIGKAVDVTSAPDGIEGDYKGTLTITGSTLGFASFPKYASPLIYIMLADMTATTTGTVTPGGTWLDGTSAAITLTGGTAARVAMLFDAATEAKFVFSGTGNVSVSNLREFEVTGCSNEARAYIAQLSNPDDHTKYYLVDYDEVNPWTYIIDMGTSPAVTIMAGLAYKLNAVSGTHTLTTDICPAGYYGEDAHLSLFVGATSNIQVVPPLNLLDALTPNAGHNITIKFRDGQANAYVDDTDIGFIVSVTSGTGSNTLYDGLMIASEKYVTFAASTDQTPIDLTDQYIRCTAEKNIVGNGVENTILSGGTVAFILTGTKKPTISNLQINDCMVGGNLAAWQGQVGLRVDNCLVTNRSSGWLFGYYPSITVVYNCTITGNTVTGSFGYVTMLTGCTVTNNTVLLDSANKKNNMGFLGVAAKDSVFINNITPDIYAQGGYTQFGLLAPYTNRTIENCYFSGNGAYAMSVWNTSGANGIVITGCTFATPDDKIRIGGNNKLTLRDTNVLNATITGGTTRFDTDTILDLSGNTITKPITGTMLTVVSGTASVVPYGETTAVGISGSGNTLLNTGKLGFLVSVASGTAANTLYDALVGGGTAYSNIIFDPAQTSFVFPRGTEPKSIRRLSIRGNGSDNTIIQFDNTATGISGISKICGVVEDVTITGFTGAGVALSASNTGSGQKGLIIRNCTFTNNSGSNAGAAVCANGDNGWVELDNCLITDNTNTNSAGAVGFTGNGGVTMIIRGSTITGNSGGGIRTSSVNSVLYLNIAGNNIINDTIYLRYLPHTLTFSGTNIFNSTVSGAGTVTFAEGAVLDLSSNSNSAVISGGTITVENNGTASVIPYGGGGAVTITGSGTSLSNMGVLS